MSKPAEKMPTDASTPPPRNDHRINGRTRRRRILGSFWFNLLAAFLVLGLVQGFLVKLYAIPSTSMEHTLQTGDRVLVNRLAYRFAEPHRRDIIVFTASDTWHPTAPNNDGPLKTALKWAGSLIGMGPGTTHTLVKRVIAVGGEQVECCNADGLLLVDGQPLDEPYIYANQPFAPGTLDCTTSTPSPRCFGPYTVPENQYFVLGDHRSRSHDSISNCRGQTSTTTCRVATVQHTDLIGHVFATIWPITRWGGVG